jgi:hypothetical protein
MDQTDTAVITVDVTVRAADEHADPQTASRWLAARIRDLTGVTVSGHHQHQEDHEDHVEELAGADYEVIAVAFPAV